MRQGPVLQFDVGNSSAKWRLVQGGAVLAQGRWLQGDPVSRDALFSVQPPPGAIWIASVADRDQERDMVAQLRQRWSVEPWFARTTGRAGDLVNSYREPVLMGVDRWLAMLAARARGRGRYCVVDAGSALTIDIVDAAGRHEGGYIVPGPELMERALLLDTRRVRFDESVEYALSPGRSTAEAVRHGIALAQAGAVALALERLVEEPPALYFCGGAGRLLMSLLDRGGEWVPDLVFEGLELLAREQGV